MALDTSPEKPAPVRAVAQAIGGWIDRLGAIWVEGQVTQISRRQGMSTAFLTLRDSLADVSVTVTANRALLDSLVTPVVEGASIVVHGKPTYYAARGSLSLQAREVRMVGLGELLARIARTRRLLAAEGLFAAERKRPLPFLPGAVGLVTSQGSAAEKDVVEVSRRRWPAVRIVASYSAMQGVHCTREVIEALQRLEADADVDVIVVARGGGSVEDLLPFSDEGLVRAVSALRTPVVSAIGHESDDPLLDLVADWRAATPTDAAKRVVPDVAEEAQRTMQLRERGRRALLGRISAERQLVTSLRSRPVLADPRGGLGERSREVEALRERGGRAVRHRVDRAADDLDHRIARVRALSPLSTLRRGYAVVTGPDGTALTDPAGLGPGTSVDIRVASGRITADVTSTSTEESPDA
ncbi:exodeoxyribonuclease 7 large subunit [Marmoricola endophyticus]|uniref:Exodeoxyribonuclease 7 large subunit n=1 Tax=Marmoricola endophyticus TaxID=2040280 RepID=A0A917BRS7_9ACTN|nr:exodeoxyribonuclease VII large subunit [Marmoricola endophyticus]GGF54463.1 exodeoxyribonuclease 7 large subunit [Marmoricola endophyticus]